MSLEHPKDKNLFWVFFDELRFEVKHTGNKNTRDECLVKLSSSPAIRAGSLKKSKAKAGVWEFYFPISMNFVNLLLQ